jgi:hypothetical protein
MRPLGLSLTERPGVKVVSRGPTMAGYSARLFGPTVMIGERHGRRVEVHQEQGRSENTVRDPVAQFEARASRPVLCRERRFGCGRGPRGDLLIGALERRAYSRASQRHRGGPQGRSRRLALRPLAGGAPRRRALDRGRRTDPRSLSRWTPRACPSHVPRGVPLSTTRSFVPSYPILRSLKLIRHRCIVLGTRKFRDRRREGIPSPARTGGTLLLGPRSSAG